MIRILFLIVCILFSVFPSVFKIPMVNTTDNSVPIAAEAQITPAVTGTPAPTPSPTPGPDATPWMNEEDTANLNRKISAFLNKEGDYTPEKISAMMFDLSGLLDESQMQLGLVDATHVEGYLFDYVEKDDSLVLIVGFDGSDGERFVAPIQIPLYYLEGDLNAHFYFIQYHSDKEYAVKTADVTLRDTAQLRMEIYKLIGKCIAFVPARVALSGSQYGYSGTVFKYFDEHNAKLGLAEKLMLSVNTNEDNIAVAITFPQMCDLINSFDEAALESWTVPHITRLDDLGRFILSGVPMIDPAIYYRK
jgi:hypothetical protein